MRLINSVSLAAALMLAALSGAGAAHAAIMDKIIVVVNDEVITQSELDAKLEPFVQQARAIYGDKALQARLRDIRDKVLDQMITDKLVISEARRRNIEVPEKEIDDRIADVKKNFKSDDEFTRTMLSQGLTMATLRDHYSTTIMAQRLMGREVMSKIVVTPTDVFNYYKDHKSEFVVPMSAETRMITIRPGKDRDDTAAEGTIKALAEQARNGGDFAELAKTYSEDSYALNGGAMGCVLKGEMLPAIDSAIFSLNVGDVSEPVKTDMGYHIFKVESLCESRAKRFDEVSKDIEHIVYNEKLKKRLDAFMDKLKQNAYIEYKQ